MGKERGEHGKQNSRKVEKFADKIKREKRQAKEDADRIRPILEKDPDWPLVSGIQKPNTQEEYDRERRGQTRLTKKAVQLLYPEYKALSSHGTGTAHNWVYVNITIPEELEYSQEQDLKRRVENMLGEAGIKYSTYSTDYGRNDYNATCLSIKVRS